MKGFQKPVDSGKRRDVRLPVVSYTEGFAMCSCGKPFKQARHKAREDAIDKHFTKKHNGRGIRL